MKKIFILFLSFYCITISSQDGILDTSFSDDGKFFLNTVFNYPNNSTEYILDLLEQSDGKTVYLGNSYSSSGFFEPMYCNVFRLNANGTLDPSFGKGGIFQYSTDQYNTNLFLTASKLMMLEDGSFLIAGYGRDSTYLSADIIVIKITPNGVLDTTFGVNGIARFAIGGSNNKGVSSMIVYNNKIYIAGKIDQDSFILSANLDGSFNTDFNSDGKIILDIDGNTNTIAKLEIINNKIYAFGSNFSETSSANYYVFVSAINLDGSTASYGTDGTSQFYYGTSSPSILKVFTKTNNKLLLLISGNLYMINKYGNIDTTFGTSGKILNPYNQNFYNCAVSKDESYFMTSAKMIGQNSNQMAFRTVKIKNDFTIDNSFGTNGEVITNVSDPKYNEQFPTRILATSDGKIIVAGSITYIPNPNVPSIQNQDYVILRYNNTLNLSAEEITQSEITIYPNPAKDILTFKTTEKIRKAEIYDLNGRLVKVELGISNNQIDVSSLKTGTYVIKVTSDKKYHQTKFIKQ